jgi:hypothetical protein
MYDAPMNNLPKKSLALLLCGTLGTFALPNVGIAMEGVNASIHGTLDPGSVEIVDRDQISAEEWTFRLKVTDVDMMNGRQKAIKGATDFIAVVLNQDSYTPQHEVIKKMLILDESYDASEEIYEAYFRVHSALEDPGYKLAATRNATFESDSEKTAPPAWVLLVPATLKGDAWGLSGKKSPWSSKWRIPFRDGATQFVPATIDADDVSSSKKAEDLSEMASMIGKRYNAPAVLMLAKGENEGLELAYFKPGDDGEMLSVTSSAKADLSDITMTRASTLEAFWSLNEEIEAASKFVGEPVRYRFVGRPRLDGTPAILTLQIIAARTAGWDNIYERLEQLEGVTILNQSDHGSSYLVTIDFAGTPDLEVQLETLNFTRSLF